MTNLKKSAVFCAMTLALVSGIFAKPKYISPNNDGVQDELVIPLKITDKRYVQGWSLFIVDENGNTVRTIGNKVALPEKVNFKSFFKQLATPKQGVTVPETVTWNGMMDNGETAPDGNYTYYFTAIDDNGNEGKSKSYEVVVDTKAPDVELAELRDKIFGEGAKASLKIKQSGSEEDLWIGMFKNIAGETVLKKEWTFTEPLDFSWNGTDSNGTQVPDGVYTYEITATDRAGNVAPVTTITNIIYSAEKPATNIMVSGSRYFSPVLTGDKSTIKFDVTIPVPDEKTGNQLTNWAVEIYNQKNETVRTYNMEKNGNFPPSSIVFDGKDDNGALLADGKYKARVTASYLNGYVPAAISSPTVILDTISPTATFALSDKNFGAGAKDKITIALTIPNTNGSPIPSWKAEIFGDDDKVVKSYDFGEYPPTEIIWNGIDDNGGLAAKGDYRIRLICEDMAGNKGVENPSDLFTFDTTEAQLLLAASESAFSPNADKVKDTITFNAVTETKDVAEYSFTITDEKGNVVYSVAEKNKKPGKFTWNGKADDGKQCADGKYTANLTLTAKNGSVVSAKTSAIELDTVAPELNARAVLAYFSPEGDGNNDVLPVEVSGCTTEKLWTAEVRGKNGTVKKLTWSNTVPSFEWDGTDESGNVAADGVYDVVISSTDEAGNSFKTVLNTITLDSRETKAYITTEYEGISPNGDDVLEEQIFYLSTTVKEDVASWTYEIHSDDKKVVKTWSDKTDGESIPATIKWDGKDNDGKVCEGTFTAYLQASYKKGNRMSAISSPFVCTANAPDISVETTPRFFSPDNDGVDDELYITLGASSKAKIKNWSFVINDPKGNAFYKTSGKSQITERMVWDGLSNIQKDSSGKAERVQSAMDYPYEFKVTDNLGMTSVVKGVIPVDVLVIRDGNVLKMAVPSIIFESDAANFNKEVAGKLDAAQIKKNEEILTRIATILKKFKDYKVTITGHANPITDDPREETEDNMMKWGKASTPLSRERADAIKEYLIKKGVSGSNLITDGKGGTSPVVDPKDKDNNWKNRRVEFILSK